jgi:uncharacterized protein (DUF608 family)
MKAYRDWRISGDSVWISHLYPRIKQSLDYCIGAWDPRHTGTLEEPHHNTYDIEFWGPDGMTTSFYLGALEAIIQMGTYLHEDVSPYAALYEKAGASWSSGYIMASISLRRSSTPVSMRQIPSPLRSIPMGGPIPPRPLPC